MKNVMMLSELVDILIEIQNSLDEDIPVISKSNEDALLFSTKIFAEVIPSSPEFIILEDETDKTEKWITFNKLKAAPNKVLHIGSIAPVLGEPGIFVNNIALPETIEYEDNDLLNEREMDKVIYALDEALGA